MDQGCEWRHAPEAWAEDLGDLRKSSELGSCFRTRESRFRPGRGQTTLCATGSRVGWVESCRCKSSQHRKIVSLSPHVEKPLNSKRWIKVSYLNQFRVFGFLYMFMNILRTLCLSHISVSWVCYILSHPARTLRVSYPSAEMQLFFSSALADWAIVFLCMLIRA